MDNINSAINEQDYIVIPNPIYDVVFRYLMQDYDSAMIILSTLINEKIKSLEFQPLTFAKKLTVEEHNKDVKKKINKHFEKEKQKIIADDSLSDLDKNVAISEIAIKDPVTGKDVKLLHLDFAAVIEKENGEEEMVIIELQKVAMETDIFRFKQYIAENFQKKRKINKIDQDTGQEIELELPYRLIPIFILNFKIEDDISDLMIKTRQIKSGTFTDKEFDGKNEFIDHLSYELYVVQLPYLKKVEALDFKDNEYKSKLFALLKLFDQRAKKVDNEYRLRLFRKVFPGFLDRVIKRLQTADIDKISWLLLNKKEIEEKLEKELQISKEKDKILEENKKILEEKDKVLKEKDRVLGEKDKIILEYAKSLKRLGKSTEEIQKLTNLSKEVIDCL